eukprot:7454993-Pyramimonas_sp.AAC.2
MLPSPSPRAPPAWAHSPYTVSGSLPKGRKAEPLLKFGDSLGWGYIRPLRRARASNRSCRRRVGLRARGRGLGVHGPGGALRAVRHLQVHRVHASVHLRAEGARGGPSGGEGELRPGVRPVQEVQVQLVHPHPPPEEHRLCRS